MLVTIIILLVIAMVAYSCNSIIMFRYETSIFSLFNPKFWNPKVSWLNKYTVNKNGDKIPKFFLSTTMLVFITDAYHLLQFIYLTCVQISFALLLNDYITIIDNNLFNIDSKIINCIFIFISIKSTFSINFELMFSKLLIRKTKV